VTSGLDDARILSLDRAIRRAEILVTTGAGGVGKTTTAAAIGLAGAAAGRRTLVMTIDPARRLAQALGLEELASSPQRVPVASWGDGEGSTGELWAMMLDMQSTFDGLIDRHATGPANARAIKSNRIYQTLSSTLSGTQEYMAMEKLHELHDAGEWDLLVIDTPPTRSALDFLDAPRRMTSFLEGRLLRLLLKPAASVGKGYLRVVGAGATAFMKVAGKVTGMDLLNDLADFFRNFEGMYEGFKERADQVLDLLQRPTSQFVVVTSPQPPPLREARFFLDRLEQEGLHLAGVVVNRIHPEPGIDATVDQLHDGARRLDEANDPDARAVADGLRLLADLTGLASRERRDVEAALFGRRLGSLVEVPLLRTDVHDLDGLGEIADTLVRST
jgi:anion-transporting  ArsA/GET3 family ATPase